MMEGSSLNAPVQTRTHGAVLDPFGGVAGDMLLAALVDLGASLDEIRKGLAGLKIEPWRLSATRVSRRHLSSLKVQVDCEVSPAHRHLADVLEILRGAALPAGVLAGAEHTFERLAKAEAQAHGVDVESVHFHEVGACDAILDICAVHFAMDLLGLSGFWVSALPLGVGYAQCAHGRLPCPVPATLRLLEGFDVDVGAGQGEMVTPTGAALVASLGTPLRQSVGVHRLAQVGYGAGTRADSVCRIWRVEAQDARVDRGVDPVMQGVGLARQELLNLSCELDDCDPQGMAFLCEQLFAAGALDARTVPTAMKKGRLGQSLEVLVSEDSEILDRVMRRVIQDSRTLGVRVAKVARYVAPRTMHRVNTPWGEVQVKVADFGWHRRAYPEYEDCARVAKAQGCSLVQVQQAAMAAWEQRQ